MRFVSFVIGVNAGNPSRLGEEADGSGVEFGGSGENLIGFGAVPALPVLKWGLFSVSTPPRKSSRASRDYADADEDMEESHGRLRAGR
ncbi:MAG: hypothetical protein ACYS8Z_01885 [Planctomycetota bacterium]